MQITTLEKEFNSRDLNVKYRDLWKSGIHLFTVNDANRDFYYSFFYCDFLFVKVIYNKLNGQIIGIKSFTDKAKLMFYLREDFN